MSIAVGASDTSERIMEIATRLVQARGYNGFSYADIASALKVTKASLHYHFPSKAKLGERLIERYTKGFLAALGEINRSSASADRKLKRYVQIYADVVDQNRMCLCGMLAADFSTLPKGMRDSLRTFFDANENWLAVLLQTGRDAGEINFKGTSQDVACAFTGALEGAMLVARVYPDAGDRFRQSADRLLGALTAK